ncbi:FimV/HubP family polar landmark protein, partial [Herbaspirillum sp. RTI4]
MHSTPPRKASLIRLHLLSATTVLALSLPGSAGAMELGKLTVLSTLGQPLRAEIPLSDVTRAQAGFLSAWLAPAAAFARAKREFKPILNSLSFSVTQRGSGYVVLINSDRPVNEPVIDMLLEVQGGTTRLTQEYTLQIEPSAMRMPLAAQSAGSAQTAASITPTDNADGEPQTTIRLNPGPSELARELMRRTAQGDMPSSASQSVDVAPTQNIAASSASSSSSSNAAPSAGPAKAANGAAAAKSNAKSDAYRVKPGDALAAIALRTKPAGVSLDQMLIALYQANPDAFVDNNMSRLRAGQILKLPDAAAAAAIDNSAATSQVVAQAKDFAAYRAKLAGRVANSAAKKPAASTQSASGKITAKVEDTAVAAKAGEDRLQLSKAGADKPGTAGASVEKIAADKETAEAEARVAELEKNVSDLQKLLDMKNKNLADQTTPESKPTLPAPVVPAVVLAKPVPQPPARFFDGWRSNPMLLPAGGGIAALLALLGGLIFWRKRKKNADAEPDIQEGASDPHGEEEHAPAAESESEVMQTPASEMSESAPEEPPTTAREEEVFDPIEEAQRYIAEGHDEQAEEILKAVLLSEPDNIAIHLKLAEIHAQRGDVPAFDKTGEKLHALTGGKGPVWEQTVQLGEGIDSQHALFARAVPVLAEPVAPVVPAAPAVPIPVIEPEEPKELGPSSFAVNNAVSDAFEDAAMAAPPLPVPVAAPVPAAAPSVDEDALNIDLGAAAATPASAEPPPAPIASKIDFDLDLDKFEDDGKPLTVTPAAAPAPVTPPPAPPAPATVTPPPAPAAPAPAPVTPPPAPVTPPPAPVTPPPAPVTPPPAPVTPPPA